MSQMQSETELHFDRPSGNDTDQVGDRHTPKSDTVPVLQYEQMVRTKLDLLSGVGGSTSATTLAATAAAKPAAVPKAAAPLPISFPAPSLELPKRQVSTLSFKGRSPMEQARQGAQASKRASENRSYANDGESYASKSYASEGKQTPEVETATAETAAAETAAVGTAAAETTEVGLEVGMAAPETAAAVTVVEEGAATETAEAAPCSKVSHAILACVEPCVPASGTR